MNQNSRVSSYANATAPQKPSLAALKRKSKKSPLLKPKLPYYIKNNVGTEYACWLSSYQNCDSLIAFTLTFRNKISTDKTASDYVKKLNQKLRKAAFPKTALRLDKFNQGKAPSIFAVIEEHEDGGMHLHGVVAKPPSELNPKEIDLEKEVIKQWAKLTKSSNNRIDKLKSKEDTIKYIDYIMKDQKENTDRVILLCWDSRGC